jgi:hypothetical protein
MEEAKFLRERALTEVRTCLQVIVEGATNVVVLNGKHAGGPGNVKCQLRISEDGAPVGGKRATGISSGFDPVWNEQFAIGISDPYRSHLEITLWNQGSSFSRQSAKNYLGEVVVNISRLHEFSGQVGCVPFSNLCVSNLSSCASFFCVSFRPCQAHIAC